MPSDETTITDLAVNGTVPTALSGRYLRIFGWGNDINRDNAYNEVQAYARAP